MNVISNYLEHDIRTYDENSMFDEKFLNELRQSGFYAKPKKTKIILSYLQQEMIVGNCVVANIEITNEKIPVYSYNADIYKKFLNGKKIITGALALRKTTIAQFIALQMYNYTNITIKGDITDIDEQIELLSNVEVGWEDKNNELITELIEELKKEKKQLESKLNETSTKEMFTRIMDGVNSESMDLLYYSDGSFLKDNSGISVSLRYEGDGANQTTLTIKDVLFVKKNTEINIGKNDIVEIYQFIGNPE